VITGDLHLDAPLPRLNSDGRYAGARMLTWLHGRPAGEAVLLLGHRPLSAAGLASQVWPQVADRVAKHCADDGIPPPGRLPAGGLPRPAGVLCAGLRRPSGPPVSVVIATRDRTESLLRCLASVSRLDYPRFDVIVADSAPRSDATAQALRARDWPFRLCYTRAPRPGLALAHNTALGKVTGELVAITDDDVEVAPGWLAALAQAFAESGATCVTGLIMPAELETRAQLLVEQAGGFARGLDPRVFTATTPEPGPLYPFAAGRFGSGANMAFRTGWLVSRGGFDPATGAGTPARGGDDLTAFLDVIIEGGTLRYEPAAVVRHWHRRDYEGVRRQAFGYGAGLGSYLTASLCARPALLAAMARRAVPGVRYLLDPGSAKNDGQAADFPRELIWRERAGLAVSPVAYAVSRWRYRAYRERRPALVRSARAGVPGAVVHATLAREGWRPERTLRTVSDTAVVMVRGPGEEPGTLKIAATLSGAASLRREREVLARLGSDERLGAWRDLLPVPLGWGEADRGGYLLTSRLPGTDGRHVAPGSGLTPAALGAIAPLHRRGQMVADVDGALLRRWADEPARLLARVARSGHAVDRVTAALHAGLTGRQVSLGWTHGDFHPGNLLLGADGQVTGIVDWDQARELDNIAADLAFWLLTTPERRSGRQEFGERVAARLAAPRCWTPDESRLLGPLAAGDAATARALLLLTWLRHVTGNLAKSRRYAHSPLWLRRNVHPVLRQVAGD
jgi:glycosyltransferase involved in cell wall biosynthesis